MALTQRPNTLDIAKQTDPSGRIAQVAEVLTEQNEILQDAPSLPGNEPMGNLVTIRSSLPVIRQAKINQGSVQSKSTTYQVRDTIGMWDAMSEVDVKLRDLQGAEKFNKYRWNEDQSFLEAFNQALATAYIYGDESANEGSLTGLALRTARLNTGTFLNQPRVLDAGGTGSDNTSIYAVDWGERAAHLIHPENMPAGIKVTPRGDQRVNDADGNPMMAAVTSYLVASGLSVKDPRHIGRIANIDVSDIATAGKGGYTGPDLILLLTDLFAQMPKPGGARRVLYCSQFVQAALLKLAQSKASAQMTVEKYANDGLIPHWQGAPIRRMDRISLAESRVTAVAS